MGADRSSARAHVRRRGRRSTGSGYRMLSTPAHAFTPGETAATEHAMATVIELRSRRPAASTPLSPPTVSAELIIFPRSTLADLRLLSQMTRAPTARSPGETDD